MAFFAAEVEDDDVVDVDERAVEREERGHTELHN